MTNQADERTVDDKAAKAARKAEKEAEEQRRVAEIRARRLKQLEEAKLAQQKISDQLSAARELGERCHDLRDHLHGFYLEVDKLAKGKSLIEATPLIVERVNEIICDSKEIVKDDVHLNRTKEFVPAGNNPLYPDVLVTARAVLQALDRFTKRSSTRISSLEKSVDRADTLVAALKWYASQDGDNVPTTEEVEDVLGREPSDYCFTTDSQLGEEFFDFDCLDRQSVDEYLAVDEPVADPRRPGPFPGDLDNGE